MLRKGHLVWLCFKITSKCQEEPPRLALGVHACGKGAAGSQGYRCSEPPDCRPCGGCSAARGSTGASLQPPGACGALTLTRPGAQSIAEPPGHPQQSPRASPTPKPGLRVTGRHSTGPARARGDPALGVPRAQPSPSQDAEHPGHTADLTLQFPEGRGRGCVVAAQVSAVTRAPQRKRAQGLLGVDVDPPGRARRSWACT